MNATLSPPIQKYLAVLERELKRHSGVSPEDALSDAREHLQQQQDSLLGADPSLDDDTLYARFVESFGPPPEVAAAYAASEGEPAEASFGYAPGWRICCTTCGRSAPFGRFGVRVGAASYHKYTLGFCRGCRWIRWLRIVKDADSAKLTDQLGIARTPDEVRRSFDRPALVLAVILGAVLAAALAPWFFAAAQAPKERDGDFVRPTAGEATTPSGGAAAVAEEWIRLVLAGRYGDADKLTDFPRRSEATHDVRDPQLLAGAKLQEQFARDEAVLIVSDDRHFEGKRGKLVFHLFRSPRHPSGWLIRDADFVDDGELEEQVAAFAAPVLLGQEIERTLGKDKNQVLDFESGRVRDIVDGWDRAVDDPLKWIAVRGLDARVMPNPNNQPELVGLALLGNATEAGAEAWDASSEQLEQQLEGRLAMNSALKPNPEQLPATFVFRTHGHPANEPYVGVLQILEIDQARQEIRFRYRLAGKSRAVNR